jgi:hypothetical protein
MKCWKLSIVLLSACATEVDTENLPSLAGYANWPSFEVRGDIPAHEDTIRVIYANEEAGSWSGAGEYPEGTVILKEVFNRSGEERADLSYIAVMRKLREEDRPSGAELQGGWMFTILDDITSPEANNLLCYESCHRAAPHDGSFFNLGL